MHWMVPQTSLGTDQTAVIDEIRRQNEGAVWIRGHAGSGKTVVLVHALAEYLILNPDANVIVVGYTRSLKELIRTGMDELPLLRGRGIPVETIYVMKRFLNEGRRFDAIFCDEVQDIPIPFLVKMKQSCTRLIMAGDSAQSIFPGGTEGFEGSPGGPKEIRDALSPSEFSMNRIYRLRPTVVSMLERVYPEMFDGAEQDSEEDAIVRRIRYEAAEGITSFVWDRINELRINRPEDVGCVLVFRNASIIAFANAVLRKEGKPEWNQRSVTDFGKDRADFESLNRHLAQQGIPLMYLGKDIGSLNEALVNQRTVIMSFHSAKGLDFEYTFIPFGDYDFSFIGDNTALPLTLVALSRCKKELMVTYEGALASVFERFMSDIGEELIDDKNPNPSIEADELPF
jgi:hypothetical protein